MNLANCPRCGKLFAKNFRDVCNDCHRALEQDYERCVEFLRENKGATIQYLSDETGVTIKQITRWIREGRISLYNAPNLSYPCEVCGVLIRDGAMCDACRARLATEVRRAQEPLPRRTEPEKPATGAYRISDRLKDR